MLDASRTSKCVLAGLLLLLATRQPASGHDLRLTQATLTLEPEGTVTLTLICDLDALALGAGPGADDTVLADQLRSLDGLALEATVERLQTMMLRRVRLRADGEALTTKVTFPEFPRPVGAPGIPSLLGTTALFHGRLPVDAGTVSFSASRAFPQVHLEVVDRRAGADEVTAREVLEPGARSTAYRLDAPPPRASMAQVLWRYLVLGTRHIVPAGPDHILFVLGLFLFAAAWKPLLLQVSAFTVAHTATLALALFGVIAIPSSVVEPLIALSIAWIGIENVWTRVDRQPVGRWRLAVVFGFGLLHGLGFAGVLSALGLPPGHFATALIGFNLGVEAGQVLVLACAFLVTMPLRKTEGHRTWLTVPASLAITVVGLFWFVERVFG